MRVIAALPCRAPQTSLQDAPVWDSGVGRAAVAVVALRDAHEKGLARLPVIGTNAVGTGAAPMQALGAVVHGMANEAVMNNAPVPQIYPRRRQEELAFRILSYKWWTAPYR